MENEHPLKIWRRGSGMTLAALADKVGVQAPFLSEIETGKKLPSLELALRLARETGISMEVIASFKEK